MTNLVCDNDMTFAILLFSTIHHRPFFILYLYLYSLGHACRWLISDASLGQIQVYAGSTWGRSGELPRAWGQIKELPSV